MPASDEEIVYLDLGALLARCLRHKLLASAVFVVVVAASLTYALLQRNTYSSNAKLVFQSSGTGLMGGLSALASLAGVDPSSKSGDASVYIEDILRSSDFAQAVLDRPWKASKHWPDTSAPFLLRDFWETESDTTEPDWQAKERELLIKEIRNGKYISISKDKKTGVITLSTQFEDPRVAYDVNRFLIDELNNTLVNKLSTKAGANREFIETRLKEVKTDLARSENILRNFRQSNRLRMDPEYQLEEGRILRDLQINQEIYLQLVKQYEMAKIDEAKDLPVLDVIDSPMLPVKKTGPRRTILVLLGAFAGTFLGLAFAAAYDAFWCDKQRLRHPFAGTSPASPEGQS